MEIRSLLHITAKRVFLLIVAAEIAAAATGAIIYLRPVEYRVSGTVYINQVFDQGTPAYSVSPFADDFNTSLTLPAVVAAASKATGESPGAIAANLSSASIGTTNNVEVSYKSPSRVASKRVVSIASHATLELLAKNELDRSQHALDDAQKNYVNASKQQGAFESKYGTSPADSSLRASYQALQAKTDGALKSYISAGEVVDAAKLQVTSANTPSLVAVDNAVKQSTISGVLRGAVAAGIVTAMLGLLLFAIPVRDRRTPVSEQEIEVATQSSSLPEAGRTDALADQRRVTV